LTCCVFVLVSFRRAGYYRSWQQLDEPPRILGSSADRQAPEAAAAVAAAVAARIAKAVNEARSFTCLSSSLPPQIFVVLLRSLHSNSLLQEVRLLCLCRRRRRLRCRRPKQTSDRVWTWRRTRRKAGASPVASA